MSFVKHYSNFSNTPVFTNLLENFLGKELLTDFSEFIGNETFVSPAVNVLETATHFRIDLFAAGLKKSNFKVQIEGNQLTVFVVTEAKPETQTEKYIRREVVYGRFQRAFTLPNSVQAEKSEAKYADGVLSVSIPKILSVDLEERGIDVEIL
jgi:HSP20 family protein